MEVILAEHAGFCFGVTKAVDEVYRQIETNEDIYTYGPIIHNEMVVSDLEKKGVKVINSLEELSKISSGTIVIRSHGVTRTVFEQISSKGLKCIDATCPFVKRIHKKVLNVLDKDDFEDWLKTKSITDYIDLTKNKYLTMY